MCSHLGHQLGDLGQVLPLLADNEAMEPGGSGHRGHSIAVGLGGGGGGEGSYKVSSSHKQTTVPDLGLGCHGRSAKEQHQPQEET